MNIAPFLIRTRYSKTTGPFPAPLRTTRACLSIVLNKHNRAFHQHSQTQLGTTRPAASTSSPTLISRADKFEPQKKNQSHRCSLQTPSIMSQPSFGTENIVPLKPIIHNLYEEKTGTWQYVFADPSTKKAVIIDSVLDYDPATQTIRTQTADSLLSLIAENGYKVEKILETHAHADHLTAASYLQTRIEQSQGYRPPICIGKRIRQVQDFFGLKYGIPAEEYEDVFDKLFDDDETFEIGNLTATAIHLPGHTPDHIGYIIGDNVFCGDSIFHPDIGTARCDFPGGNATSLFESGQKLLRLPDHIKIWSGHDYVSDTRNTPVPWMTVRDHKESNKHLSHNITKNEFISQRQERDAKLEEPKLLNPSLQVNIRAGKLPHSTPSGHRFLHLPLKLDVAEW